jgi:hypothetical protein
LRFLALVLILSGVGYLHFTDMSEGARRISADMICDSDFEPIAAGSWVESLGQGDVLSEDAARAL